MNLKRLVCLVFALIFALAFTTVALAAGEDIIDQANPGAAPQNVQNEMYGEDEIVIPDESIPEGSAEGAQSMQLTAAGITIEDAVTPASGELVQTGGVPAYVFYIAGGICILAAIVLATRKGKESNAG